MMIELEPKIWQSLLTALETMAETASGDDPDRPAEHYRSLARSLNDLGKEVMGGRIDGYWLRAKIRKKDRVVIIKLVDSPADTV